MAARARQLPYVVAVTALVTGLPAVVVWALRTTNIITSVWIGLALAVALSFTLSVAGSKIWEHGRYLANTLFSELFIWGWLRRVYVEHRISRSLSALDKLGGDSTVYRSGIDRRRTLEERAQILTKIAAALDADDPYLNGHSRRVARYATGTARRMGLHSKDVATVQTAAELHDIGKLQLPPDITRKPGRLSTEEFAVVKRHTDYGADMVRSLGDPALAEIVRDHHEHYDGTGYPSGLRGTGIPLAARIIAVADTFDAITADRSYRRRSRRGRPRCSASRGRCTV